MSKYYTIVTKMGQTKIAAAAATGKKVEIKHIALGDGGGEQIIPDENMTSLVNEVWRGDIASYENAAGSNIITIIGIVPSDVGGWTAREMAAFDSDGEMIAVCNMPDTEKTLLSSGAGTELTFAMKLVVSSNDSVTVIIDSSIAYIPVSEKAAPNGVATLDSNSKVPSSQLPAMNYDPLGSAAAVQTNLDEHIKAKNNPHKVTAEQIGAAEKEHKHSADEITSGILTVPRGGTGAEAFTADFPLFGDGEDALKALKPQLAMAKLGYAYGVCKTAAATTAKTADIEGYVLFTGSHAFVKFTYDVPAGATLNINGTGAKKILRWNNSLLTGNIMAGDIAEFVYDGLNWNLVGVSASLKSASGSYTGTESHTGVTTTTITVNFVPVFAQITSFDGDRTPNESKHITTAVDGFSLSAHWGVSGYVTEGGTAKVTGNSITISNSFVSIRSHSHYYFVLGY